MTFELLFELFAFLFKSKSYRVLIKVIVFVRQKRGPESTDGRSMVRQFCKIANDIDDQVGWKVDGESGLQINPVISF